MMAVAPIQAGGTLGLGSLYIHRPADDQALAQLEAGEYCNILTTRQVGKSSLVIRLRQGLKAKGTRLVSIDLAGDLGTPESQEGWFIGFLEKVALDLDLDENVESWWATKAKGTKNQRLTQFFREVVAVHTAPAPLVVFVDEVDSTIKIPYADDLFMALRTMYNQRAMVPEYAGITFCLIGAAAPNELIKDRRTTPYNIGVTIELDDFDAQRDDLSALYAAVSASGAPGKVIVKSILRWTGGHPFLTMVLCQRAIEADVRDAASVDAMVAERFLNNLDSALRTHVEWINNFLAARLRNDAATLRLYGRILAGAKEKDRPVDTHVELKLSGLVKRGPDGWLVVRNLLYARRFGLAWLSKTQPMRLQFLLLLVVAGALVLAAGGIGTAVHVSSGADEIAERAKAIAAHAQQAKNKRDDLDKIETEAQARVKYDEIVEFSNSCPDGLTAKTEIDEARRVYEAFWDRRAVQIEAKANDSFGRAKDEEGFLLLALAAVKRGKLSDAAVKRYEESPYRYVAATLRGPDKTKAITRVRFLDDKHVVGTAEDDLLLGWTTDAARYLGQNIPQHPSFDVAVGTFKIVTVANEIVLWNANPSEELQRIRQIRHPDRIVVKSVALALDPSDASFEMMALAADIAGARVYRFPAGAPRPDESISVPDPAVFRHLSSGRQRAAYSVRFSTSGKLLITAADDGVVRVWSIPAPGTKVDLPRAAARVANSASDARFSADDKQIVVAGDSISAVYDTTAFLKNSKLPTLSSIGPEQLGEKGKQLFFVSAALSPLSPLEPLERQLVASAVRRRDEAGGSLVLWYAATGEILFNATLPLSKIRDLTFSPSGDLVATAWEDGAVRLFQRAPIVAENDPKQLWKSWQKKFGLTVLGSDETNVVPLGLAVLPNDMIKGMADERPLSKP